MPTPNAAGRDRHSRHVYVGLTILDETDDAGGYPELDDDGRPLVRTLTVGKIYRVQVRVSKTGIAGSVHLNLEDESVELHLAILKGQHQCVKLPERVFHLAYDDTDTGPFTRVFDLIVTADCPRLTLTLAVIAPFVPQSDNVSPVLAKRTVELDGHPLPQPKHVTAMRFRPGFTYPPDVASLSIEEESPGVFLIKGYNSVKPPQWEELRYMTGHGKRSQPVEMARFVARQMTLDDILGFISSNQRHFEALAKLIRWFNDLLELHRIRGTILNILITDHTGSNFPWEWLYLGPNLYLGALARVVRWIPAATQSGHLELHVDQETRHGEGLAFLDPELGGAARERTALAGGGVEFVPTLTELGKRLREGVPGATVVHLACHGKFTYKADNLNKIREKALETSDPADSISVLQLERIPEYEYERPLFIVNACHSARLRKDGGGLYGLAEVLLTRCADAYIGTLGPVNTDYAGDIGAQLANAMTTADGGLHAAEFLRSWRAHAAAEYHSHENDSDPTPYAVKFVYAFMYVYFGNPFALWSLNQRTLAEPEPEQEAV